MAMSGDAIGCHNSGCCPHLASGAQGPQDGKSLSPTMRRAIARDPSWEKESGSLNLGKRKYRRLYSFVGKYVYFKGEPSPPSLRAFWISEVKVARLS